MGQFGSTYHFFFYPWRHQKITSAQLLRKSEQQLQGTGKKRRHGIEGNSARIYIHFRNLKIYKNFSYLKLSHIKYSSGLLKQERLKNGGSGKLFNYLIVVGDFTLIFIDIECLRVDFPQTTKYPPNCPNFVLL